MWDHLSCGVCGLKKPKTWQQIVLVVWMVAVVSVHWIVQPAAGYREAAAQYPMVAQAGKILKPLFHKQYKQ